jgi:hypothetical protein
MPVEIEWTDNFRENARRIKAAEAAATSAENSDAPPRIPDLVSSANRPAAAVFGNGDPRVYGLAGLRRETDAVALAAPGSRNHTLNTAAFNLGSLVAAGALSREEVEDALTAAALAAGLTPTETKATIRSGLDKAAVKVGPRQIPDRPPADVSARAIALPGQAANGAPETEAETRDLFQIAVARQVYDLRVRDTARRAYRREEAAALGQQPPHMVSLGDFLAVPDEDAVYRIAELLPVGGRALLAAQYKAGKTTLVANLLRSLVDGTPFLGRFPVDPLARIVLLDTELDARMLRRWLRTQSIQNVDAINVVSLRGRLTTFDITDDDTRAEWAARIAGAQLIVLDCLRPCLDALGLSEDKDAGRFLVAFDALIAEAGASEAVVVHHMGHGMERSRGDSRLLDWPDVLWKIVRETRDDSADIDEGGARYFSAMGRDVMVAEGLLDYTPQTGGLMLAGGNRADKRARNTVEDIVDTLSDPAYRDGLSRNELVRKLKGLGHTRDGARRALAMAVEDGVLMTIPGPRNTHLHILNPSRRQ